MFFLIFQSKDMLKLCLNFSEDQPIYAYKRYAYKKIVYSTLIYNFVITKGDASSVQNEQLRKGFF